MIKKLLTAAIVVLSVAANAQNSRIVKPTVTAEKFPMVSIFNEKTTTAPGCATVSVINPTANITRYSIPTSTDVGCGTNGGYVYGTNCYGDKESATYFSANVLGVTNPSITAASVYFYRQTNTVTAAVKGTKGTTGVVKLNVYASTSNTNAPGTLVTSTMATLSQIVAAYTNSLSNAFVFTFTFAPVAVPATGFYLSVVNPTTSAAGDTIAIYTQTASASAFGSQNNAWVFESSSTWSTSTSSWGLSMNHAILPILCGTNITTGISNNLGLSKDVKIMPNPSTGLVNVAVTIANSENISVTVTNALGQQIISNKYDGISNETISLDLTSQSNGVYFVTVSNGKDKMVQRLILNK